jgi:hypothetical protein
MAKKAYVNDGTNWVELASATTDLSGYITQSSASTTYAAKAGATFTGNITAPEVHATTKLVAETVGGDEGGEILLGKPATNSTIAGTGVTIDLWQNRLRLFEQGGNARGAFLDIPSLSDGVASQIALTSNTTYVGTTAIALNRASATQTLTGITLPSGQVIGSLTVTSGAISSSGDIAITPSTSTNTLDLNSYVRMSDVYNRTSSSGANMLIATNPLAYVYRSTASSGRWKNSIDYLSGELEASKLLDLPVRQFKFNNDYLNEDDKRFDTLVPGFVAEEVAQYYPIAAEIGEDGQVDDWNVRMILPPMLKLIQDQANKIEELEQRISAIESN